MSRPWRVFFLSWVLFSALACMWALATPVSAGPDEPAHLVKAASVARGQLGGTAGPLGIQVTVPRYVAETHNRTCFAFHPDRPASCAAGEPAEGGDLLTAPTTAGLYNPTYYALVGWPTLLFTDDTGIYATRIVSAVLSSLFLAFAAMLVTGWRRGGLVVTGVLAAATPMVLFLDGVVNPNAVETTATLAAFCALLALILDERPELVRQRTIVLLISGIVAANMRGASLVWLVIVLLLPLLLLRRDQWSAVFRHRRLLWVSVIVAAIGAVAALLWTVLSNSLGSGISGSTVVTQYPGVGTSPAAGFATMLSKTFDYGIGLIGQFGWMDTAAPAFVVLFWSLLIGSLLFAGLVALRSRALLVFIGLVMAVVLTPAAIQAAYVTRGGYIWQGRYTLPLFVCLMLGAAALLTGRLPVLSSRTFRRSVLLVGVLWSVAQLTAFAWTLKRYTNGVDATWKSLIASPSWQPPGGVVVILGVTTALLIVATYAWLRWVQEPAVPGGPITDPVRVDQPRRSAIHS